ncbi:MAG TPA: hypothetical protein VIK54_14510 [Acidimicrobiia bacterium]
MPDDASLGRSFPEAAVVATRTEAGTEAETELPVSTATEAKSLIDLAERMGIPADAAIRQVGQIMAELDGCRHRHESGSAAVDRMVPEE